jgi:drug/metabolite transporter (DMT)-like permease
MVVVATILYGVNINIIKHKIGHIHPLMAGMLPLSVIAFPALIIVFMTGTHETIASGSVVKANINYSLICIAILGMVGTAIALFLFNGLVQKTSALFGSAVNYLLPFVAAFWGLRDGESFGVFQFLSLGLILLGIYLISIPAQSFSSRFTSSGT